MVRRSSLAIAASILAICGLALTVVMASQGERHDVPFEPLGISAHLATRLPPEKAALWEAEKRRHETAVAQPIATPDNPRGLLSPVPPQDWPLGITENLVKYASNLYVNQWHGTFDGMNWLLLAGSRHDDRSKGTVAIMRFTPNLTAVRPFPEVVIPDGVGTLRVVSATERTVRVASDRGVVIDIDVASGATTTVSRNGEPCCSVQLDVDPGARVSSKSGARADDEVQVEVLASAGIGEVSSFSFEIVYDDTAFSAATGTGGLAGNPDFNETALGSGWTCELPEGSGTPDIDPLTGPGHGVAMLACYTTGVPPQFNDPTVLATLRLNLVGGRDGGEIALRSVVMGRSDGFEAGSCDPAAELTLVCIGASVEEAAALPQ